MTDDVRRKLDTAVSLVRAGRVDDAERVCRQAMADDGDDINLLGMLGAVLLKKGEWDEAERTLLRTIELEPGFAKPYEDLGALYLARNQPDKAVDFFQQAVTLDPRQLSARQGLAVALHRTGRQDDATALQNRLAGSSPLVRKLAEADEFRKREAFDDAERCCSEVLAQEPQNIAALRLLAIIATDREQFVAAENCLRRILKVAPQHVGALLDFARFLGERGRYTEAIEALEDAARLTGDNPDVHLLHGDMLAIVGRSSAALRCYEDCLSLRPDDPQALLGSGHMLRVEGRREAAEASYRRCTELCPELGGAWWHLASLRGYRASDTEIALMQSELDGDALPPDAEVAFRFALARAHERREDYARAWEQYARGNTRKRGLVKYDPVETELQQRKIRDAFTPELFSGQAAATPTNRTPIFIVGMPRSGSTLIEQILASHSRVEGTGELPYIIMLSNAVNGNRADDLRYPELVATLTQAELTGLGRSYLHHAGPHCPAGTPFFTDKMPANFSHVGLIRLILPHAKIIDARRTPMATCVANYRQLFAQGKNQSYDLTELGEYYLRYVEMMDHWDAVIPGAVLRVQYEQVVADLEGQVRRILEFCGLSFEASCVAFHQSDRPVNTASSEQVREPLYRTAVDFWKHYEPYLDELRDVLAPIL